MAEKELGKEKLNDTLILKVKFKNKDIWRIVATNRKMSKLDRMCKDLEGQIEEVVIATMDSETGIIT